MNERSREEPKYKKKTEQEGKALFIGRMKRIEQEIWKARVSAKV